MQQNAPFPHKEKLKIQASKDIDTTSEKLLVTKRQVGQLQEQ